MQENPARQRQEIRLPFRFKVFPKHHSQRRCRRKKRDGNPCNQLIFLFSQQKSSQHKGNRQIMHQNSQQIRRIQMHSSQWDSFYKRMDKHSHQQSNRENITFFIMKMTMFKSLGHAFQNHLQNHSNNDPKPNILIPRVINLWKNLHHTDRNEKPSTEHQQSFG